MSWPGGLLWIRTKSYLKRNLLDKAQCCQCFSKFHHSKLISNTSNNAWNIMEPTCQEDNEDNSHLIGPCLDKGSSQGLAAAEFLLRVPLLPTFTWCPCGMPAFPLSLSNWSRFFCLSSSTRTSLCKEKVAVALQIFREALASEPH